MTTKSKNIHSKSPHSHQITIGASSKTKVDFNSSEVKKEIDEVKKEVKAVLESATIDPQKLSLHFTI
jgi:hypothetical protein